ncbi:MAG: hypothetical protein JXR03_07985 [Cyclobacteriaceae bacterium]
MMSRHTKKWTEKKAELIQKEKDLKNELETVSNIFEGKSKKALIGTLIFAFVALAGYIGYKSMSPDKKSSRKKAPSKKKNANKNLIGSLITERLINTGLKYLEERLANSLKGDTKRKKEN